MVLSLVQMHWIKIECININVQIGEQMETFEFFKLHTLNFCA